jgi:hypothetical protein
MIYEFGLNFNNMHSNLEIYEDETMVMRVVLTSSLVYFVSAFCVGIVASQKTSIREPIRWGYE